MNFGFARGIMGYMDETPRSGFFGALAFNPNVRFDVQHDGETVLLLIRSHPITQIPWIINSLGLLLILVLLDFLIIGYVSPAQFLFVNVFIALLIFAYAWLNFLLWFFRVGLVTNERIVDIDFKSILYKEESIAKVSNIEEITAKSAGYISSLFNFGNVFVQTAGSDINIEFHNAPDPNSIVKFLNELSERNEDGNPD
jgi:membrane protein YdbS with pleckstrin-like domain